MKVVSLNVKGITNPIKEMAIKQWVITMHKDVDSVCLQEVETTQDLLMLQRLKTIMMWLTMAHTTGFGGSVIGILANLP